MDLLEQLQTVSNIYIHEGKAIHLFSGERKQYLEWIINKIKYSLARRRRRKFH
jgi:hypothetical protein